jgi:uroporphyrinogen decarboxylase
MQKPTFALTPKQRMLNAYQGLPVDKIPVAPEFWYYIPARLLNVSMIDFELEIPHWKALQETFNYYQCEGWGIIQPEKPAGWGYPEKRSMSKLHSDRLEECITIQSKDRTLVSRILYDPVEPSWQTERFIKNFHQDWPIYEKQAFVPPIELDWHPVQNAIGSVGEDYLLEVYVGLPFIDFAGGQREGGLQQVIQDLYDYPDFMNQLQDRYIHYMIEKTRAVFQNTTARSIFIASIWSTISLLSPKLWLKWDKPILDAVTQTAHEFGGLVHHHFHGKCMKVLPELAQISLDCICPFERPPGGDVVNLYEVRNLLMEKTTFNGNVATVETLIKGTPPSVRNEVEEILSVFQDSDRLIIGSGDQVGRETPDENIFAMIEAVRNYSK